MELEQDEGALRFLYDSMKDAIIDVAAMDDLGVTSMKKFLYEHGKSGDVLRVNVSCGERQFLTEAMFLEDGSSLESLDRNLFLPFDGVENAQDIVISDTIVGYSNDTVTVDGKEVGFGSPFFLGGRRVVLAKGSVVLLLEDSLVRVFPESGLEGEIVENEGTLAVGDVITTGISQLEKKEDSGETSIVSYVFLHDASTDQRVCVSKRTHTVDFPQTTGSFLLDLGFGDGTLEKVLEYNSTTIGIRSVSSEGIESVATIDVDGLSFSSDDSSVTLGTEFRIRYDEYSDTVQIQYLDTSLGQYVTKMEFGR